MNYSNYSVEDFVLDENFQQWVKNPDAKSNAFWDVWIYQNPTMKPVIDDARKIILEQLELLKKSPLHTTDRLQPAEVSNLWNRIAAQTLSVTELENPVQSTVRLKSWIFARAASVTITVIMVSLLSYYIYNTVFYTSHSTAYGEIKKVTLPDGSVVILNADSKIKYAADWENNERKVWLDGEAFFDVVKKPATNAKFTVHTADVNVEVLGTQFNVANRKAQTSVTLQEGKIKLDIHASETLKKMELVPGDQVVYSSLTEQVQKKNVNPENYSSWTNNLWILENTSLADVANRIETIYGKKVIITDTALYNESITGVMPAKNFESLIEILSTLYDVQVKVNDNEIIIYK